ncbi:MAG TPA: hypothetical protein VK348_15910, partial [Planctomycetota bacterium]|nr:hypothetical protein [Planctomycetota bacterium]
MKTLELTAVLALLVPVWLPAQDARAELAKIIAVEEQEHDLGQAEAGYRALLARADTGAAEKAQATLRLGRVLQRLGKQDEAKVLLEQAAAAGGEVGAAATRALQGQGPDVEREKELRGKARDLVARVFKDTNNGRVLSLVPPAPGIGDPVLAKDLLWIGDAATPEIISAIHEWAGKLDQGLKDSESWAITGLAAVLWQQGGKAASEFLTACASDPNVALRRLVARSAYCAERADMVAVAAHFLRDPDPDAEVQSQLLQSMSFNNVNRSLYLRLPLAEVIDAALAGNDKFKRVVLEMCTRHWPELPHQPSPAATLDRLLPMLGKAMASTDPEVGRTAQEFLGSQGMVSVRRGIELLLAELPKLRGDFAWNGGINREIGLEEARALLPQFMACARALGPIESSRATGKQGWVAFNLAAVLRPAEKDAMPVVLELLQLGYDEASNGVVSWACGQFAGPEHAAALFACFDKTRPDRILSVLGKIDLPAAMFPALRDKAAESVRANKASGAQFAMAIARTGVPEAAD